MEDLAKLLANLDRPGVTELVLGTGRQVTMRKGGAYLPLTPDPISKAQLGRWLVGTAFEALIPDHEGASDTTEITVLGRRVRTQLTRNGKDLLVRIEGIAAAIAPPPPPSAGVIELDDLLIPSAFDDDAAAEFAPEVNVSVDFDLELSALGAVEAAPPLVASLPTPSPKPLRTPSALDALAPKTVPPVRFKKPASAPLPDRLPPSARPPSGGSADFDFALDPEWELPDLEPITGAAPATPAGIPVVHGGI
ncbi:MAG: hypothetical protein H0T79_04320, partial [Deltaproteobacteria bacterium]|nr:hypothetical protein [Deltaproteobacteria bacterium]